jgi:hypothetical protein
MNSYWGCEGIAPLFLTSTLEGVEIIGFGALSLDPIPEKETRRHLSDRRSLGGPLSRCGHCTHIVYMCVPCEYHCKRRLCIGLLAAVTETEYVPCEVRTEPVSTACTVCVRLLTESDMLLVRSCDVWMLIAAALSLFYSRPVIIPRPHFHLSLDALVCAHAPPCVSRTKRVSGEAQAICLSYCSFSHWCVGSRGQLLCLS